MEGSDEMTCWYVRWIFNGWRIMGAFEIIFSGLLSKYLEKLQWNCIHAKYNHIKSKFPVFDLTTLVVYIFWYTDCSTPFLSKFLYNLHMLWFRYNIHGWRSDRHLTRTFTFRVLLHFRSSIEFYCIVLLRTGQENGTHILCPMCYVNCSRVEFFGTFDADDSDIWCSIFFTVILCDFGMVFSSYDLYVKSKNFLR
jgi:hypothetical protein